MAAHAPLYLSLGSNGVLISCHDPALYDTVHRYFCHCVGETSSPIATYDISRDEDGSIRLSRDGEALYDGNSSSFMLELLIILERG